ncbi:YcgN family cysteine cluster protein [Edwardsiella piscicida]|uniref:UPF0260 protein ETAF_1361 n=3 Tax=Edwardsiella TaxID=635 RepID=A0A0H3DSM3_EDWTF|nr:YcgN family cysteine cluster protein [Edwardsiella piscicida]ACY84307.1 hypothetical protein ETAE_1466 [Edwardsiella tarda EIB202]ADM41473.1 hypothetical protein ETAF_1361 [Edwardsiella tarda FL6-60]AGH73500.1 hypothetical protein ETAC_06895 [Edwardsiella piscicida C07-087]AOP42800.1 YcgN family cysteine cluster protein [Edwardsiella piscicida]ARD16987.1 hypothetical protein BXA22_00795 [Edwardsiella piscicida]
MGTTPFWQEKTLEQMSDAEWEALCDGCGQCCLHKLQDEDTDEIYFTNVACNLLNIKTCQCRHYARRFEYEEDCIKLTRENLPTFEWLPPTCAYRLLSEGAPLPTWHPLRTGSKSAMHAARISVRYIAVRESEVSDWEQHIMRQPLWQQGEGQE